MRDSFLGAKKPTSLELKARPDWRAFLAAFVKRPQAVANRRTQSIASPSRSEQPGFANPLASNRRVDTARILRFCQRWSNREVARFLLYFGAYLYFSQ